MYTVTGYCTSVFLLLSSNTVHQLCILKYVWHLSVFFALFAPQDLVNLMVLLKFKIYILDG